jgi:hypothetical protein
VNWYHHAGLDDPILWCLGGGNLVSTQWIQELSKKQVSHVDPESVIMYAEVGVCCATSSTGIIGSISSSEAIHLH